jgi:hypothetical protein
MDSSRTAKRVRPNARLGDEMFTLRGWQVRRREACTIRVTDRHAAPHFAAGSGEIATFGATDAGVVWE